MWTVRRLVVLPLLCLPLLLLSPSRGYCYEITAEQLQTLTDNLTVLQSNNERLSQLLTASQSDLTTARNDLDELMNELAQASQELNQLRTELQTASDETQQVKTSLQTANVELQNACQSVKQLEARQQRLKRQRLLWQVIAAVAMCTKL